jgi:hypothetical protein
MARQQSDLTNNNITVSVRLTKSQWQEWKCLGGPIWLRLQLAKSIEAKRLKDAT